MVRVYDRASLRSSGRIHGDPVEPMLDRFAIDVYKPGYEHPGYNADTPVLDRRMELTLEQYISRAREDDQLFNSLVDDVLVATDIWKANPSHSTPRRIYVRSVFACIEGVVQVMKSASVTINDAHELACLSAEELCVLREQESFVADNGALRSKKMRISLLPNLLFTVHIFERVKGVPHVDYTSDPRMPTLREAIQIRDRLTHPRRLSDLEITLDDIKIVDSAASLFREMTGRLFKKRSEPIA